MTASVPEDEPITFINVFDIPEDEIDTFIAKWEERSQFTTTADGFISAELYRAVTPDTEFKLINVAKWQSMAHFKVATTAPAFTAELGKYQSDDESTWTPHRGFYRTAAKFQSTPPAWQE